MSSPYRYFAVAIVPLVALILLQTWQPYIFSSLQSAVQRFTFTSSAQVLLPRSDVPLIVTAFPHWSHYEKIAKIAVALANNGYPITLITGSIFEDDVKKLHPNITFWPIRGKPDKFTEEEYKMLETFEPGSDELSVFMAKNSMIGSMSDQHETLQEVFQRFREKYNHTRPLISLYDVPFAGHHPILLGAPGIKPDATFGLSNHPITLDSDDAYPFHVSKPPHVGPDAKALHHEANQPANWEYKIRTISAAYWDKLRELGVTEEHDWHIYHTMAALPDHLMSLGVPEFDYPRSDLRPNVHYFGGFKKARTQPVDRKDLPDWWDDVEAAKQAGKKVVAVSQGTLAKDLNELLIPTLKALDGRNNVLVIATTVATEPEDIQDLQIPENARIAKFVPYDLLMPSLDVLVNNGGYGAVIQSLQSGVPVIVAGHDQDKNLTNTIVEWTNVGVKLKTRTPSVDEVREGVTKVLDDEKYKRNAEAMKKHFEKYDMGTTMDKVIQSVVQEWLTKKMNPV